MECLWFLGNERCSWICQIFHNTSGAPLPAWWHSWRYLAKGQEQQLFEGKIGLWKTGWCSVLQLLIYRFDTVKEKTKGCGESTMCRGTSNRAGHLTIPSVCTPAGQGTLAPNIPGVLIQANPWHYRQMTPAHCSADALTANCATHWAHEQKYCFPGQN